MLPWLISLLCFYSLGVAQYKIGVIISQSGQAASTGQEQIKAVNLFIKQLQNQGFTQIEILLRDDASHPQEALEQAKHLIETQGVVALVCCTLSTSVKAISDYVTSQAILLLSPSDLPTNSNWMFSTKPNLDRLLQSVILQLSAKSQQSIGVMTLNSSLGSSVEQSLQLLLSPGGMRLGVLQTYSPEATVLTPEALWVATRLPESVLVWGLARDSALAYKALRERGYEREVILNPDSLNNINLLEVEGASFILSPVHLANSLPTTHPSYLNSFNFASQMAPDLEAAYLYDALNILKLALEQVFTYGIPKDDIPGLRYALRDSLIGLSPYAGVAASYDYSETDPIGIDPYSLVIGKVIQGQLVFQP
jgi:branched-chain amino acid transport system substrate-binding protein